jgi:diadenosine tetraphosphate (Ap4A) HIT family hydrolase
MRIARSVLGSAVSDHTRVRRQDVSTKTTTGSRIMPRLKAQLFVISKRHYLDFAEMMADEAATFGTVMRSLYAAMRQVTQAERIYAQVMLEGIPHFHVWFVPQRKDDTVRGRDFIAMDRTCSAVDAHTVVAQLRKQLISQADGR